MLDRTVTFTKQHTPNSLRVAARRAMLEGHNAKLRIAVPVVTRNEFTNVFHCAARKTASQWITALFSDPIVYRHSGLRPYVPRYYRWQHPQEFPPERAVLSLFVSWNRFATIPKPEKYRAFYVLRDPRDILVSSYFSTRDTHAPMGDIPEQRKVLLEKPFDEGLRYLIAGHAKKGVFRALRSWVTAGEDERIRLVKYEDLTGERQPEEVDRLLRHCGIALPEAELAELLDRYSFRRMRTAAPTAGTAAHYRKGTAGDWRNHFDDDLYDAFEHATGNLISLLGYPPRG